MALRRYHRSTLAAAIVLIGGCASGSAPPSLSNLSVGPNPTVSTNATETYTLIARGIVGCWFGASGPLTASHILHADAAPPSAGGSVEIALHERDGAQPNPRGVRAFLILLTNETLDSGSTRIAIENKRLPDDLADAMRRDTLAWARGGTGCEAQIVRPPPPPPPAMVSAPAKKVRVPLKPAKN